VSYEFDQQELELRLEKCIASGKLREILANAGIPKCRPVQLSIKCIDSDTDVIKDYVIPTINSRVGDFEQEMREFFDQAEEAPDIQLLSAFPKSDPSSDGTTKTHFISTFTFSKTTITFRFGICCNQFTCRICF